MKFTIDLEEKKILIHDSFSRKELDQLFSILNIDDMDNFVIDKYYETTPFPNQPITQPINPYNPYYPDWTLPNQPYITYTNGTFNVDSDNTDTITYGGTNTATVSQLLLNEID